MNQEKRSTENQNSESKLYFTSDQLAFFDEENALDHAKELDDQTITTKTKAQVEAELEEITRCDWKKDLDFGLLDELDAE